MAKIETLKRPAPARSGWDLDRILEELRVSREVTNNIRHGGHVHELPSPDIILNVIEGLCAALFPTHLGQAPLSRENTGYFVSNALTTALGRLADQVHRGLKFNADGNEPQGLMKSRAEAMTQDFAAQLPTIRAVLVSDLKAAYQADPSANSIAEILLCYRGATAVIYHRIAHALDRLGARLVARVISDLAHASTGIDIHPGARIGESFFIGHGTGVVIGETAVIGNNVQLSQAVTLEADRDKVKSLPRHPILEDDVIVYAGATILGPVTVGKGSVIGGNVWLIESVPPGSIITQAKTQADCSGPSELLPGS